MARPKTRNDELRSRMLTESLALLDAEGTSAVTARRVATVAETSTAAVYELFGNKSGLIHGIFSDGFERLAERIDQLTPTSSARDDLIAIFDTTRAFAVQSPRLFEVMFARPFAEFHPEQHDREAAGRIYTSVTGAVAALLGTRRNAQSTVDAAHVLVALDRGLIAAELAGQLGTSSQSIERRRTLALDATINGLTASNEAT